MAHRLGPVIALVILAMTAGPVTASPATPVEFDGDVDIVADLEGVPIALVAVARFHCNDFDFPAIHCFKSEVALGTSVEATVELELTLGLLAATDYVQVYQDAGYGGSSMVMSQDYPVLAFIGWNDRISSFRARNSQTGTFYTDWFAGGSSYGFCCNQQVPSLGGFNDTFSSVYNN